MQQSVATPQFFSAAGQEPALPITGGDIDSPMQDSPDRIPCPTAATAPVSGTQQGESLADVQETPVLDQEQTNYFRDSASSGNAPYSIPRQFLPEVRSGPSSYGPATAIDDEDMMQALSQAIETSTVPYNAGGIPSHVTPEKLQLRMEVQSLNQSLADTRQEAQQAIVDTQETAKRAIAPGRPGGLQS